MATRTIQMTDEQIKLLARAIRTNNLNPLMANLSPFNAEEIEELCLLAGCADDTAKHPDTTTVHGWCL
jgi:hypothetical protein